VDGNEKTSKSKFSDALPKDYRRSSKGEYLRRSSLHTLLTKNFFNAQALLTAVSSANKYTSFSPQKKGFWPQAEVTSVITGPSFCAAP
jgi:hypothetical protein